MYGLYSRAACNQERLMMARVRYVIFFCFFSFSLLFYITYLFLLLVGASLHEKCPFLRDSAVVWRQNFQIRFLVHAIQWHRCIVSYCQLGCGFSISTVKHSWLMGRFGLYLLILEILFF